MYNVLEFIRWALTHVKRSSIPQGANLALPIEQCGAEEWNYLFGSVKVRTTQQTLDYYYNNHYGPDNGMSRATFDYYTRDWDRNGWATDCQGLCDAWFTHEKNEKTDINANMNYTLWCQEKGKISDIDRPYVIGEALFTMKTSSGKMTHVGWICGFMPDGTPLAVEARGLAYGVVITRVPDRNWTHRGLMKEVFSYDAEPEQPIEEDKPVEQIIFERTYPMKKGEPYRMMQAALNACGYTDNNGDMLDEDGKWGDKSQQAFDSLLSRHVVPQEVPVPVTIVEPAITTFTSDDGKFMFKIVERHDE